MKTRRTVLYLLLNGARELGSVVRRNIKCLLDELSDSLSSEKNVEQDDKDSDYDGKLSVKGTIQDRYKQLLI